MRHDIFMQAMAARARGVHDASLAGLLIASSCLTDLGTARLFGASAAVTLTSVAAATNQYLNPAAGTQKQASRRFHRRSLQDAEDARQRLQAVEY